MPNTTELPSERPLGIRVLIMIIGMLGSVALVWYLYRIGFFPDVSVMS